MEGKKQMTDDVFKPTARQYYKAAALGGLLSTIRENFNEEYLEQMVVAATLTADLMITEDEEASK